MPAAVDRCVKRILPAIRKQYKNKSASEQEQIAWATCTKMNKAGKLRRDGDELIL